MAQETVEIVRRMLADARRDPEVLFGMLAEDVEWVTRDLKLPGPPIYHGPDGVRAFFRDWVGAFEEWGYEAEQLIDGGDAIVVELRQWGRGRGSGAPVDTRFWQTWTLRGGLVVRATHHLEKEQALEVAGLRE